jgi:hypothetical protein
MLSAGYTDLGEEWAQKTTFRQDEITRDPTLTVVLFDDSVDQLDDTSDAGDVTTEPTTGAYSPETVTLDSTDIELSRKDGDLRAEALVGFDLSNTIDTIDATAALIEFTSDVVNQETSPNTHLIYSAPLEAGTTDTARFTSLEVQLQLDLA